MSAGSLEQPGQVLLYTWPLADKNQQGLRPSRIVRLLTRDAVMAVNHDFTYLDRSGIHGNRTIDIDLSFQAFFAIFGEDIHGGQRAGRWPSSWSSVLAIDFVSRRFPERMFQDRVSDVGMWGNFLYSMGAASRHWIPFFDEMILSSDEDALPYQLEDVTPLYGSPCYDVSVYFALGAPSPVLLPLDKFKNWVENSPRICEPEVGPSAPTRFIEAVPDDS